MKRVPTLRRPRPGQTRHTRRRPRPPAPPGSVFLRRASRSARRRLDAGYRAMARAAVREREAWQWAEATVGDVADDNALSDKVEALLPLPAIAGDETKDRLLVESGLLATLLKDAGLQSRATTFHRPAPLRKGRHRRRPCPTARPCPRRIAPRFRRLFRRS